MLERTSLLRPSTSFPFASLGAETPLHREQGTALNAAQTILALPFDAMRQHHGGAVIAGLVPRALLHSARVERWVQALEALPLVSLGRCR
jgi:hypothetical protein